MGAITDLREGFTRRMPGDGEWPGPTLTVRPLAKTYATRVDNPMTWLVRDLWQRGGSVLLVGPAKAGKTTLIGNLARSLSIGDPFLGEFETATDDHDMWTRSGGYPACDSGHGPAIASLEMSEGIVADWYRQIGVADTALIVGTRETAPAWNVTDKRYRHVIAEMLAEYDPSVLIVDPLTRLLDIADVEEDSNSGIGKVWGGLVEICEMAGIPNLFVAHHTGHGSERSRGASRLLGMPDAIWTVHVKGEKSSSPRTFSAKGRDVDLAQTPLSYDRRTRRLTVAADVPDRPPSTVERMLELIRSEPGLNRTAIRNRLGLDGTQWTSALAAIRPQIEVRKGPRNSDLYHPTEEASPVTVDSGP